ncbi:MAG: tol-pal system protein YbgF [Magnetococcales bacterium]|nr:tol-pal system protein YbgF [Magnetococcales bacterium]MBF0419372.1 tol-pal system protein YbgF [Magnetococcales bacterium]
MDRNYTRFALSRTGAVVGVAKPWVPVLFLMLWPLSACVSGSSSSSRGEEPLYLEGTEPVRPPVRTEVGPPPPPAKLPLPEVVNTLSNRLERTEDQNRNVTTNMERRLGLMEKEITSLRGEVEVLQHAKSKLETELEAKNRQAAQVVQPAQAVAPVQTQTAAAMTPDDPDYDPADQGTARAGSAPVKVEGQPAAAGTMVAKAAPQVVTQGKKAAPAVIRQKPENPKQAYDEAFSLLKGGRYEESLAAFKSYMEWFPNDTLLDNAQYWIGELYYVQRKFPDALMAFNQVLVRWPTSSKVPASLLKIGFSFFELNDMDNAKNSLTRLVSDYPESPAVSMAKQRLEMIEGKVSKH